MFLLIAFVCTDILFSVTLSVVKLAMILLMKRGMVNRKIGKKRGWILMGRECH